MADATQVTATAGQLDGLSWLRVILAFVIVGGLLAGLGFALNYMNLRGMRMPGLGSGRTKRLQLIETLPIDARRRLALIRCDGEDHLLLLGAGQDIVVKSGIPNSPASLS